MKSLTWDHVAGWRLARQGLGPRGGSLPEALRRVVGVQAQVMSAAELALWARVDGLRAADVQAALWQDRSLVKTWAMRQTLHLFTAEDLPLIVAARSLSNFRFWWLRYFDSFGVSRDEYLAYLEAVPRILGNQPLTREQLAAAAARHTGNERLLPALTASSWGSALKASAFRGDLCFGPTQGRNVAFVHPDAWLGAWQEIDPKAALREVCRRYLSVYGPATPQDFARWWGEYVPFASKVFQDFADELEPVEVEGWKTFALRASVAEMERSAAAGIVRLLPMFDVYTFGLGEHDPLIPSAFRKQVYRSQGWISAVVLVEGRLAGVWEYRTTASRTLVTVRPFGAPPHARICEAIEAEAERLNGFLDTRVSVVFAES